MLENEDKISQDVDDTNLLLKYNISNLNRAIESLRFFHSVFGLKVDIEKNKGGSAWCEKVQVK